VGEDQDPSQPSEPSVEGDRLHAAKSEAASPPPQQLAVEEVEIDPSLPSEVIEDIVAGEKTSAKVGGILGFIVIVIGAVLLILGVSGSVDLTFSNGTTSGHLVTGAVGIVISIIGGCIMYFTRYRVKVTRAANGGKGK
jgi:hypothetical protein